MQLQAMVRSMRSPNVEERFEAVTMLAEIVSFAYGEDGRPASSTDGTKAIPSKTDVT